MTREQQKKFHAMIRDISRQLKWAGEYLGEDEWKKLIIAGAYGQKIVPNPFESGFVVMNKRETSRTIPVTDTADLLDQLTAFGNENLVNWSDPTKPPIESYE